MEEQEYMGAGEIIIFISPLRAMERLMSGRGMEAIGPIVLGISGSLQRDEIEIVSLKPYRRPAPIRMLREEPSRPWPEQTPRRHGTKRRR